MKQSATLSIIVLQLFQLLRTLIVFRLNCLLEVDLDNSQLSIIIFSIGDIICSSLSYVKRRPETVWVLLSGQNCMLKSEVHIHGAIIRGLRWKHTRVDWWGPCLLHEGAGGGYINREKMVDVWWTCRCYLDWKYGKQFRPPLIPCVANIIRKTCHLKKLWAPTEGEEQWEIKLLGYNC